MRASLTTLAVSAVYRNMHPDSPNTYGITFALQIGVHFPQEGAATSGCAVVAEAEPGTQPPQAGKESQDL